MGDATVESQHSNAFSVAGGKVEEVAKAGKDVMNNATAAGASSNWVYDLQKSVVESKDSAIRSANGFRRCTSYHLRNLQDRYVPHAISNLTTYEDAFFTKLKDGLAISKEHPAASLGVVLASSFILMRGPRRFLLRQTWGRFESEETARLSVFCLVQSRFHRAEKSVKNLFLSVDQMKKDSQKLLERAALAHKDIRHGHAELMGAGNQIRSLAKSVYKVERQASDLVDGLREIPGREAMKLRVEVASMASNLKKQKTDLDKKILKISELGIPV
ncbi:RGS1-HXK1-interacting protein 1 [Linum grandiflorum]